MPLWKILMERIKELETPCFILDQEELTRNIVGFRNALLQHFSDVIIGYSVKTNSVLYCMSIAQKNGCYAEVVSFDEYHLAKKCGYENDHIIYNGPMKSKETFIDAVSNGGIVNIETKRELEWLKDLPVDKEYRVGLRLNINISRVSSEDADGDNDNSRFGFSDETDEFKNALSYLESLPNIKLAGLHIHRTAHSRSVRFYMKSIKYACDIIRKYGLSLDYLDVGGGFFGIFPNKPTYQEYADGFYEVLKTYGQDKMKIIVEPGNALVASCFSFLSKVIDVKHVEKNRWFITTDGSRNDVDPFFRKTGYITEFIGNRGREIVKEQIITGCTCLEYDRLFSLDNQPLLAVGNRILYKNVGAYTMCLTPLFIRYLPNIYLRKGQDYVKIRDKWTEKEYSQNTII